VPVDRERWVGVCEADVEWDEWGQANPFSDHCLVMSYDRLFFDPAANVRAPRGERLRTWLPTEITYGLSFDPKPKE